MALFIGWALFLNLCLKLIFCLMVVKSDYILGFFECLNAPLPKALAEIDLGIVCAILGYKPETTDLCTAFRGVSLLNFDRFSRLTELDWANQSFGRIIVRRDLPAFKLCLSVREPETERLKGLMFLVDAVENLGELDG